MVIFFHAAPQLVECLADHPGLITEAIIMIFSPSALHMPLFFSCHFWTTFQLNLNVSSLEQATAVVNDCYLRQQNIYLKS